MELQMVIEGRSIIKKIPFDLLREARDPEAMVMDLARGIYEEHLARMGMFPPLKTWEDAFRNLMVREGNDKVVVVSPKMECVICPECDAKRRPYKLILEGEPIKPYNIPYLHLKDDTIMYTDQRKRYYSVNLRWIKCPTCGTAYVSCLRETPRYDPYYDFDMKRG